MLIPIIVRGREQRQHTLGMIIRIQPYEAHLFLVDTVSLLVSSTRVLLTFLNLTIVIWSKSLEHELET